MPDDLEPVFDRLRTLLLAHQDDLVTAHDEPGDVRLDTGSEMFGSVRTGKRHVSFHLFPLYLWPDLMDGASPELARRKQGKSCLNFSKVDETLFAELEDLTRRGLDRVKAGPAPD